VFKTVGQVKFKVNLKNLMVQTHLNMLLIFF